MKRGRITRLSILKITPELAEGFKDDNPLANSSSYEIYLNEASSQATLVTYLENLDGIRQVNRSDGNSKWTCQCRKTC